MFIYAIILVIMIILITMFLQTKSESFDNLPLRSKVHVKLDRYGNTIYQSPQSPPMNGELGCTQVPCPSKYPDDYICWCCCNY